MKTAAQTSLIIFNHIQGLNPKETHISSLGSFVSSQTQQLTDYFYKEILSYIPENTLAYSILISNTTIYSYKQLWIIAMELQKNIEFVSKLIAEVEEREAEEAQKKQKAKDKLKANKGNSSDLLIQVKSAGLKLGDYYSFVKGNKKFAKEFYTKKFTQESVNEFINKK